MKARSRSVDDLKGALLGLQPNHKGGETLLGWARNGHRRATVDIFADDVLLMTARRARLPLKVGGFAGALYGFKADFPPNFASGQRLSLTASARTKSGSVEIGSLEARRRPFGERLESGAMPLAFAPHAPGPAAALTRAAIIVTQDGAPVLRPLFESILRHEPKGFRRIVVVDHASTDDTEAVIAEFARRLPLTLHCAPRESSFSESNNLGARHCDEDVLFFVNNDIVLTEPVVATMTAHLTGDIGVVGLRLMDPPFETLGASAPQHVGVHFCATPSGIVPFESRWLSDAPNANRSAIEVPAVTAALCAIRRERFHALGGFDERYRFGMEDIDLCLRSLKAGYRNISVNSVAAIHVGSFTRRKRARASTNRNRENLRLFHDRWSENLATRLREDLLARPGYWSGRRIHIGLVLPETFTATSSEHPAKDVAASISQMLPASTFLQETGAVEAAGLDILILVDPAAGLRTIKGREAVLVTERLGPDTSAENILRGLLHRLAEKK